MKGIERETRHGFKVTGILIAVVLVFWCMLGACTDSREASVETPEVQSLDQPAEAAGEPAGQEAPAAVEGSELAGEAVDELPEIEDAGDPEAGLPVEPGDVQEETPVN